MITDDYGEGGGGGGKKIYDIIFERPLKSLPHNNSRPNQCQL